jgi:hypothetical protein
VNLSISKLNSKKILQIKTKNIKEKQNDITRTTTTTTIVYNNEQQTNKVIYLNTAARRSSQRVGSAAEFCVLAICDNALA